MLLARLFDYIFQPMHSEAFHREEHGRRVSFEVKPNPAGKRRFVEIAKLQTGPGWPAFDNKGLIWLYH